MGVFLLISGLSAYSDDYSTSRLSPDNEALPSVPYHGMRLPPVPQREFCVEEIFASEHDDEDDDDEEHRDDSGEDDDDDEYLEILVRFSLPIDPRTLDKDNVLKDKRGRSVKAEYEFNRQGTVIRIRSKEDDDLSLSLDGLKAFNGDELLKMKYFEDIEDGFVYYEGGSGWRKF